MPRQFCSNVICEMAVVNTTLQNIPDNTSDDCQDVDKILSVVVKRRKTIPTKCLEINKQICAYEVLRLETAKVVIDENDEKENFKETFQKSKKLKAFQFNLQDLHEAEQRLEKYFKRIKEINAYLEKRKKGF